MLIGIPPQEDAPCTFILHEVRACSISVMFAILSTNPVKEIDHDRMVLAHFFQILHHKLYAAMTSEFIDIEFVGYPAGS